MSLPVNMNLILCPVLSFTEQCIRGYYPYHDTLRNLINIPQHLYKADTGFIQSTLSRLNLLNHRTHKGTMFIDDGGALQRHQQSIRHLWLDRGCR